MSSHIHNQSNGKPTVFGTRDVPTFRQLIVNGLEHKQPFVLLQQRTQDGFLVMMILDPQSDTTGEALEALSGEFGDQIINEIPDYAMAQIAEDFEKIRQGLIDKPVSVIPEFAAEYGVKFTAMHISLIEHPDDVVMFMFYVDPELAGRAYKALSSAGLAIPKDQMPEFVALRTLGHKGPQSDGGRQQTAE